MSQRREIGVSLEHPGGAFPLIALEESLGRIQALGFRLVEIDPSPFAIIVNGELRSRPLGDLRAVLGNFDLRYSIHGISRLNLAYDPSHELCRRIMQCQVEACRAVGATTLVYHSGLQALDGARRGTRRGLLTDEELQEGARREVAAFRMIAPLAADAGVVIGIENLDPHQWEYDVIERFGGTRADLDKHLARLRISPIVRQIEAIGHPHVRMTLDVAHLFLAAHDRGFDYLDEVSRAAPYVAHLHVSDNFGRLDRGYDVEHDRWAFGEADMHMPPGWGGIPLREVLRRLSGSTGDVILEIEKGFQDWLGEARDDTLALMEDRA